MSAPPQPSSLPPALAAIRANKPLLFLLAGTLGGAAGSVLAEFAPGGNRSAPAIAIILTTGIWFAVVSSVLASSLFAAGEWHQRHDLRPRQLKRIVLFGALAGFASGVVAQAVFWVDFTQFVPQRGEVAEQLWVWIARLVNVLLFFLTGRVFQAICWGLMGAVAGALLSRAVPNLSLVRGFIAGSAGGFIGGFSFIVVSEHLADAFGRLVGLGTLGFALGLAMIVVEKLFREASLEVIWAPGETTNFNLGAQAVTIGGGEDHVFVRGLPHHFASIVFANGVIEYVEAASGARTPLKDGSRLEIGKLNLVIHAAK